MITHQSHIGTAGTIPVAANKAYLIISIFALICCFAQGAFGSTEVTDHPESVGGQAEVASQVTPQVVEQNSLSVTDPVDQPNSTEGSEYMDAMAENLIAEISQQETVSPAPAILSPVTENDYGKPYSSSGSIWLGAMGWVIIFILASLVISPLAMRSYTSIAGIAPFVIGGAFGGLMHEIEKGGRKYTSATVNGAILGFLMPLAIALIGPLGIYYFAGRPLLHKLGDAEAVLCCTKTEYWRLDELKVSGDGRWLAIVTDTPKPVFSERTSENLAYLIDLNNARFIDWPGTSSLRYQEVHTPKEIEGGLMAIDFDAEKGGLLARYGAEYINETRHYGTQRIETGSLGLKNLQLAAVDPQIPLRYQLIAQADDHFDVEDQQSGDRFSINVSPGWARYEISGDGRVLALIHPEVDSSSSLWAFLSSVFVGRWEVEFWDLEQRKLVKRYTQYLFDINRWIDKDLFTKRHRTFLHGTLDGRRWFHINSNDNSITVFDLSDKVRPALSTRSNPPPVAHIAAR